MTDGREPAPYSVVTGNADEDGSPFRGWLMGHFVPGDAGARQSDEVEVKWGRYATGFGEAEWTSCQTATTLVLLVSGTHEIELPSQVFMLSKPGDYLLWGPGVPHRWRALDDCLVITVRWPSVMGDVIEVSEDEVERFREHLGA